MASDYHLCHLQTFLTLKQWYRAKSSTMAGSIHQTVFFWGTSVVIAKVKIQNVIYFNFLSSDKTTLLYSIVSVSFSKISCSFFSYFLLKFCHHYIFRKLLIRTLSDDSKILKQQHEDQVNRIEIYFWYLKKYVCFCVCRCAVRLCIITWLEPSWPWSYGSWIYNYLCNQCLSPQMLWVQISLRARCTTLCDRVCQWLQQVGGFLRVLRFPPPIKLTTPI
jgi:hypothetical protein